MKNESRRLPDGRELIALPCGHETVDAGGLEIACPACSTVFQRVGLRLEAPERWRLPEVSKQRVRI